MVLTQLVLPDVSLLESESIFPTNIQSLPAYLQTSDPLTLQAPGCT